MTGGGALILSFQKKCWKLSKNIKKFNIKTPKFVSHWDKEICDGEPYCSQNDDEHKN